MNCDKTGGAYKAAGVDVNAGYRAVELMREHVRRTETPGVLSGLGGFGGLFAPDLTGVEEPVLVSGTDGVGTKLRLAFLLDRHDTVGIDCVAMCVNDIACTGAAPLFFLDYIVCEKNIPEQIAQVVAGIAEGCVQAGCALLGGETAEHPGCFPVGEYDLAGFAVGIVDKSGMLNPQRVRAGDVLVALPSSGVHSNGFSLIRKVFSVGEPGWDRYVDELGAPLGDALLTPTRIYIESMRALLAAAPVRSACHITGGGFFENIPRALPGGLGARIRQADVRTPPVFALIEQTGGLSRADIFGTFNMGVGMIAVVPPDSADAALRALHGCGEQAYLLGEVVPSDKGVELV